MAETLIIAKENGSRSILGEKKKKNESLNLVFLRFIKGQEILYKWNYRRWELCEG